MQNLTRLYHSTQEINKWNALKFSCVEITKIRCCKIGEFVNIVYTWILWLFRILLILDRFIIRLKLITFIKRLFQTTCTYRTYIHIYLITYHNTSKQHKIITRNICPHIWNVYCLFKDCIKRTFSFNINAQLKRLLIQKCYM